MKPNTTAFLSANARIDLGLFLMRAMVAVVFVFHGGQKLFGLFGGYGLEATAGWMESVGIPLPLVSATLAGSAEFFGGLLLLIGFGARTAALFLTFTMLVATSTLSGFSAPGGMEFPLTLAFVSLGLALTGPGRFALPLQKRSPATAVQVTTG